MDDCNCSLKNHPTGKNWMVQAHPPKEASTFERMNDRPELLFSNMTNYFKNGLFVISLIQFLRSYCIMDNLKKKNREEIRTN